MTKAGMAGMVSADDAAWRTFVLGHPSAHPFHHPAWAATITDVYGYEPLAATVRSESGEILGGLPIVEVGGRLRRSRWIALPFTDACTPLLGDGLSNQRLGAAVAELQRQHGVGSVEIRSPIDGFETERVLCGVNHRLTLTDPDAAFRSFEPQVRRNIRKALGSGVTVRAAEEREDLTRVYFDLHVETRRRLGVPPQPRRFFEAFWRRIIEPGLGFVLLAQHNGAAIAGAVFLEWNGLMVYKYGASDHRSWPLRPNNVLFWECVRAGWERGVRTLDFGRSDLENEGLRRFKESWGATEEPLVYTSLGRKQKSGAGIGERILRPVVRTSPTWVGRTLGEALYRFAA